MTPRSDAPSLGVVVPAAGSGERLGRPKALLPLAGRPVLERALEPFLDDSRVRVLVVALGEAEAHHSPTWLRALAPRVEVVTGGETRMASVHGALEALPDGLDVILVHDAARPFVTRGAIDRCVEVALGDEGAVAGWPVADTIKRIDGSLRVLDTPDRSGLWAAQTPQGFPAARLVAAYRRAVAEGGTGTDDAEIFQRYGGGRIRMVQGTRWNLKITYPEDLEIAEILCAREEMNGDAERIGVDSVGDG